jgi:translation initiation factor 3 subunit B
MPETVKAMEDLEAESAELDGYFSDTPLTPKPNYPKLHESFETAVILTNLPRVGPERVEKLTKVIYKLVSRIGNLASNEKTGFTGLLVPTDPNTNNSTLGFCICEYETPEEANNAINVLQGYKFDKNHPLTVLSYERALQLREVDTSEFVEPTAPPFVEKPNATEWLQDENQRDEFVIRFGKETHVFWSDGKNPPVLDYDGKREKEAGVAWCEYYTHWSGKGSYLATLVPSKGVILWSGKEYTKIGRFPAPGVQFVVFSPQENYLMTNNNNPKDPQAIKIFNIQTGKLLRVFPLYPTGIDPLEDTPPPAFQWSHDDKYFARMGKDLISIFDTGTMKLLDRRSLAAEGVCDFQWSPKANVIAYWVRYFMFGSVLV